MEIRTYTNLRAFNRLGMSEFGLDRLEYDQSGPSQSVIFVAGKGYAAYFGAEIKFIEVEYIASSVSFAHSTLHQAPMEDFSLVSEYPGSKIYCFEEHFDEPVRHYIVARAVEITVHYAGEDAARVFGPSDQIEQSGEDEPVLSPRLQKEEAGREETGHKRWWQWW